MKVSWGRAQESGAINKMLVLLPNTDSFFQPLYIIKITSTGNKCRSSIRQYPLRHNNNNNAPFSSYVGSRRSSGGFVQRIQWICHAIQTEINLHPHAFLHSPDLTAALLAPSLLHSNLFLFLFSTHTLSVIFFMLWSICRADLTGSAYPRCCFLITSELSSRRCTAPVSSWAMRTASVGDGSSNGKGFFSKANPPKKAEDRTQQYFFLPRQSLGLRKFFEWMHWVSLQGLGHTQQDHTENKHTHV